jgi:UDP-3-O-[3-hydroxymyristoyl] glucosamine N-acyltransferase
VHPPLPVPVTVDAIAARVGARFDGQGSRTIVRLAPLETAGADCLSFLSARRHARTARISGAAAILVSPELQDAVPSSAIALRVDDPYVAYARVSQWFEMMLRDAAPSGGIDPRAGVAPSAELGAGVSVAAGAQIGAGAHLGDRCRVASGCVLGDGVRIGPDSVLHPNVVVYAGVTIGARAIIHAGTVIGADGFGFAPSGDGFVKIAQLGSVRIGDDVEIGANCAVDRGALEDTVIEDGVKIDNLVQVAHNVRIGAHTVIAGCVGIAGSAVIGRRCMIGGGVGIAGHLNICDGAVIGGFSLVERSVDQPGFYSGAWPLQDHAHWERTAATLKQLPQLRQRLRAMAARLDEPKDSE